jgi:lysozyme family protein
MAKIEHILPIIFEWEGGISDHKNDKGGLTNMGLTLSTWKSCGYDKDGDGDVDKDDLLKATKEDVVAVLKKHYWDRWQADKIKNQSIANLLVDWLWNSGIWGIKLPQCVLKLKSDGIVGPTTLNAINDFPDQKWLFEKFVVARRMFIENIIKEDPSQKVFYKGWINRLNSIKWSNEIPS